MLYPLRRYALLSARIVTRAGQVYIPSANVRGISSKKKRWEHESRLVAPRWHRASIRVALRCANPGLAEIGGNSLPGPNSGLKASRGPIAAPVRKVHSFWICADMVRKMSEFIISEEP